jgi:hypothetical protein
MLDADQIAVLRDRVYGRSDAPAAMQRARRHAAARAQARDAALVAAWRRARRASRRA